MTMNEQLKRLILVSKDTELPKRLISYDGRTYILNIFPRVPSGWVCSYDCIYHDDIYVQDKDLKKAKRKLAIKINGFIEQKLISKSKSFKEELKKIPSWIKSGRLY